MPDPATARPLTINSPVADAIFASCGVSQEEAIRIATALNGRLVLAPPAASGEAAGKESRDEERRRINRIKTATCLGCLAAAMGEPLHSVADTRYTPRSYEGDAWEDGWEFIHGSALEVEAAELRRQTERLKGDVTYLLDLQNKWLKQRDVILDELTAERTARAAAEERLAEARALAAAWRGSAELENQLAANPAGAAKETHAAWGRALWRCAGELEAALSPACPDCGGTGGYAPAYVSGGEIVGPDACAKCNGTGVVAATPPAVPAAEAGERPGGTPNE